MEKLAPYGKDDSEKLEQFRARLLEKQDKRVRLIYEHVYDSDLIFDCLHKCHGPERLRRAAQELSRIAVFEVLREDEVKGETPQEIARNVVTLFDEIYRACLIVKNIAPGSSGDKIVRAIIDYRPCYEANIFEDQREIAFLNSAPLRSKVDVTGQTPGHWRLDITLAMASQMELECIGDKVLVASRQKDVTLAYYAENGLACGFERILAAINQVQRLSIGAQDNAICLQKYCDFIINEIDQMHKDNSSRFIDGWSILQANFFSLFLSKIQRNLSMN